MLNLFTQADLSDPAYASGDLDSPARRSSRSLDPSGSGQFSSQRSLGGMLSLPTFKAQRRQPSGDMGSEVIFLLLIADTLDNVLQDQYPVLYHPVGIRMSAAQTTFGDKTW